MTHISEERSLGELFASLSKDTATLVRQEIELARTELSEQASEAAKNAAGVAVGGAVAYAALILIVIALAIKLADVMETWLAFLIVGAGVAVIGLVIMQKCLTALKHLSFVPEKTIETLKENKAWVQQVMK